MNHQQHVLTKGHPMQSLKISTDTASRMKARSDSCALVTAVLLSLFAHSLLASTFTVLNVNESGPGSLHQAILDANANTGPDTVVFNIPGPGPHTIRPTLLFDLPAILETILIDGYSQPGSAPNTNGTDKGLNTVLMIEIDGSLMETSRGLWFNRTAGSRLRGIAIYGFPNTGSQFDQAVRLEGGEGNRIEGCFIGTDASGLIPRGNSVGINMRGSHRNVIGGDAPEHKNLISGNEGIGISMLSSSENIVIGNLIGTDISGTSAVGNGLSSSGSVSGGVATTGGSTFANRFGGGTPETRNVISGNSIGLAIWNGDDSSIVGNYIGTDVTGTAPLGNQNIGVYLRVNPSRCVIGGLSAAERNIISANGQGISLSAGASENQVLGNYIGTDVSGAIAMGNQGTGVSVSGPRNLIGGTEPGARNIISANGSSGIGIRFSGDTLIQGNYIGTDVTGTVPFGNGLLGISMDQSFGNVIGGPEPGAGNLIAASELDGIGISATTDCVIQGNLMGTDVSGTLDFGNGRRGVSMQTSSGILVGGLSPAEGNVIANSGEAGIAVFGSVLQASFRGNAIFNNKGLGIDFYNTGPTLNDLYDADLGPNNLQNYPVVVAAAATPVNTWISGVLESTPNTDFEIDFYANSECDASGFGEGANYLGTAKVTTDASGRFEYEVVLGTGVPVGSIITATATDPDGNTSEFSPCLAEVVEGAISVLIDIKPNDYPNCFNNDGKGVIPVAILGSEEFDTTLVDPASVTLEGMGIRVAGNGKKLLAHLEDINQDGFVDLVLQIEDFDGIFEPGSTMAMLEGQLYDGTFIQGSDELCVVPNP